MPVCAVELGDVDTIRELAASVFGVSTEATFLKREVFTWKYLTPRPDWKGPRSWIMKNDEGQIVAHIGAWPVTLRTPTGPVVVVHPLDWVANPAAAGSGSLLFRNFLKSTGTLIGLGGTQASQRLAPGLGFEKRGRIDVYAKWFVPPEFRGPTPAEDLARQGLQLASRLVWRRIVERRFGGWSAEPVTTFPEELDAVIDRAVVGDHTFVWSGSATLNYFLTVPIRSCRGFLLRKDGQLRGYFILSRPGNQTRVADLRVDTVAPDDWKAAYLVATEQAREDPEAHEMTAYSSTDLVKGALNDLGFTIKDGRDIRVQDRREPLTARLIQFAPIASDAFLLYNPKVPYLTSSRKLRARAVAKLRRWARL